MTRDQQIAIWELESRRPWLELEARFLSEVRRRGLRLTQVQFARLWRRKKREAFFGTREMDFLLKATYLFPLSDQLNAPNPMLEWFKSPMYGRNGG